MLNTGIICEYNPLHLGHKKQLDRIREEFPDDGIICLMSGNFVQRGKPAVFDKLTRAKAAVLSGADLVLELPVTAALSSAEGFASEGVQILSRLCHRLCFGAETADRELLINTARILLSEEFKDTLRIQLDKGLSFPAARQAALGANGCILETPNNILAVEYCKAILSQNSHMEPYPILREGSYHDATADPENPSATAVRGLMESGSDWEAFVPDSCRELFSCASVHTLKTGETAVLARLRTMTDEEFEALPYGSEGLWRKLMKNARSCTTLEGILTATKSKRYTRTRLDRMVMCAFLGLTETDLSFPAPYTRVLAFNDKGREILRQARQTGSFPNIGEKQDDPYQIIENRVTSLYGLFSATPESPDAENTARVQYIKK